jgi:hypothetical protein
VEQSVRVVLETLFRRLAGLQLDQSKPPVRSAAFVINGLTELHITWDPSRAQPARAMSTDMA